MCDQCETDDNHQIYMAWKETSPWSLDPQFTIYRRSRNPRPSKIAGIAFSIRALRVPDCFAPAK
jgi:hypothetical protein